MKEKPKHIDAFQFWFGLTEKGYSTTDSVKTTAKHCGVIPRTIWKWYKEFGWEDKTVYGFIGRFEPQKNPIFLIDIMGEIMG